MPRPDKCAEKYLSADDFTVLSDAGPPPPSLGQTPDRTDQWRNHANGEHELVLTRLMDAPRDKLFRCWTDPELIKQWFAPKPYTTPVAEMDLRVGGASNIVMQSPEGQEMPNPGHLSGNRAEPEAGVHRRLYRRLDGAKASPS